MKGTFVVRGIQDMGPVGLALKGTVESGKIFPGMEARHESTVIIIRELASTTKGNKELKSARKGQRVLLIPKQMIFELLKPLENQILEFEDIRTVSALNSIALEPEPV